jgi:hypothetical protein
MALLPKDLLDELCASPNDFDCIPRGYQVKLYVDMLRERGVQRFMAEDISQIFAVAAMKSPRSGKKVTLSARKAAEHLERLVADGCLKREGDEYVLAGAAR